MMVAAGVLGVLMGFVVPRFKLVFDGRAAGTDVEILGRVSGDGCRHGRCGEQTGALPEMLSKIAETYDAEVDNAATALTSILEPLMIVFLAAVVGSIVVATEISPLRVSAR